MDRLNVRGHFMIACSFQGCRVLAEFNIPNLDKVPEMGHQNTTSEYNASHVAWASDEAALPA